MIFERHNDSLTRFFEWVDRKLTKKKPSGLRTLPKEKKDSGGF